MSDIFREVDEDIRQEKYRRLWDRFGPWVIVVAVLIVVGTGGYRGWQYWQETQAQEAGDKFMAAVELSESANIEGAIEALDALGEAGGGYPQLAKLRVATEHIKADRKIEALEAFDQASRDPSVEASLQSIAALRAGYLAVDLEDYAGVADRVEGLTGEADPFRAAARELLALAAWKAGNAEDARKWVSAIENDTETPAEVSRRVGILSEVIRSQFGAADGEATGDAQ
ncbi:putative TPR repeat-containing protein [Roseibium sp. TrichSKD4]|uniref:tetratricopeptide repeat protein n=1 Tax=Roseibium sp. TrichSKD4 TaxID=744980 RepID=UPI0001E5711A|nr:tetratricopeptide repeat protein [Roseibium sp. TrichSKD4]EFO29604.1 putative TPR repeat-containing protein [Roseibium sp. TrichSKD4]